MVFYNGTSWKMNTLIRQSHKIAFQLHKKGVSQQSRMMISIDDPISFIRFFLAGLNLGAVVIPLDRKFTNDEIYSCLRIVKPSIYITDKSHRSEYAKEDVLQMSTNDFELSDTDLHKFLPSLDPDPDDVCVILFTSGSTGSPKAVQLSATNFISSAMNWNKQVQFRETDTYLLCLPLAHVGGLNIIIRGLLYGFNISITIDFDANNVSQLIQQQNISLISLVPTMMSRLLQYSNFTSQFSHLRFIIIGGGPISDKLLKSCRESNLPIMVSYGMTETCSGISGWLLTEATDEDTGNFIGYPFDEVKVKVDDSEIVVSGSMIMKGYIGESDCSGTHYTGDLATVGDNNKIYLSGRKDNIIISGGENVNPQEVINVIMQNPEVNDCEIITIPDDEWGMKMVAFIVPANDENSEILNSNATGSNIRKFCKERLANYKIPKDIIFVDSISRADTGKLLKTKLMSIYKENKL